MTMIYVEGGGKGVLNANCRKAFHNLFGKGVSGHPPKVVAAGPRGTAFRKFRTACSRTTGDDFVMLLVDSESPVSAQSTWDHLRNQDSWDKPDGASDDNAHLMVQCMEAWFLADKDALASYFGQGFKANALPDNPSIEQVPKSDVLGGLGSAARPTSKRGYNKGRDSFGILGMIDPVRVKQASPHAARLFRTIAERASR